MVRDGILERFPALRGRSIERGALWVVPWLMRLDLPRKTFGRTEPLHRDLPLEPSQANFADMIGRCRLWRVEEAQAMCV